MSIIRATVSDQSLIITDAPRMASGGKGTNRVAFEFCELWDGFIKTAVFYNKPSEKYKMVIDADNICDVPPEVIQKKGRMFFGVFGIDGEGRIKTSEIVPYFLEEGAYDENAAPSEPTEEFWEQILAEIAKLQDSAQKANTALQNANTALQTAEKHAERHKTDGADPILPSDIGAAERQHAETHFSGGSDPITPGNIGAANKTHSHGSITSDGKIGSISGKVLMTGTSGKIEAKLKSEAGFVLSPVTENISGTFTAVNNKIYFGNGISNFIFTCDSGKTASCRGFVTFGTPGTISLNGFDFVDDPDDILSAAEGSRWEFDLSYGCLIIRKRSE